MTFNTLPKDLQNICTGYVDQLTHTNKFALCLAQINRGEWKLDVGYSSRWSPSTETFIILEEMAWDHIPKEWEIVEWEISVYKTGALIIYNDYTHLQTKGFPRQVFKSIPFVTSKDVEDEISLVWDNEELPNPNPYFVFF